MTVKRWPRTVPNRKLIIEVAIIVDPLAAKVRSHRLI
jgi:hypothetical protein